MPQIRHFQYQIQTIPLGAPTGESIFEDKWNYQWSEPVRFKQDPRASIALMASGLFFFPVQDEEATTEDRWHSPWSEPVRHRPQLLPGLQSVLAFHSTPVVSFGWYGELSYPTELMRQRMKLRTDLQSTVALETPVVPPAATLIQWFSNLSEPVRLPVGLRAAWQRAFTGADRLLPTPDVTIVMAATETNLDVFLGAINVYDSGGSATSNQGARVSISEVPVPGSDGMSIRES